MHKEFLGIIGGPGSLAITIQRSNSDYTGKDAHEYSEPLEIPLRMQIHGREEAVMEINSVVA